MINPNINDQFKESILFWQQNPLAFCKDIIGFTPTEQQEAIINSVAQVGSWTSVKSGHGVGKTSTLACLGLWFISVFVDAKVPVTSPSKEQLKSTLWGELRKWHKRMKEPFRSAIDITSEKVVIKGREDTFIQARTARKENPDALQGFHAEHLLFLVDEASGVPSKIFEVAMGALTTVDTRFILTGNPTQNTGFFYDTFHKAVAKDRWNSFTLSCLDSDNVKAGFEDDMAAQYGRESNEFRVRVLGEFPDASNMQFIGRGLINDSIGNWFELVEVPSLYNFNPIIFGVDVARYGDDSSAVFMRQGLYSKLLFLEKNIDTNSLAKIVGELSNAYEADSICVDVGGVGAGVFDYLFNHGYPAVDVNFGSVAEDIEQYNLRRSEIWGLMREWLRRGGCIENNEALIEELVAPEYGFTAKCQIVLEAKDSIKKRSGGSPDMADALALTFGDSFCTAKKRGGIIVPSSNTSIVTSNDVSLFDY